MNSVILNHQDVMDGKVRHDDISLIIEGYSIGGVKAVIWAREEYAGYAL